MGPHDSRNALQEAQSVSQATAPPAKTFYKAASQPSLGSSSVTSPKSLATKPSLPSLLSSSDDSSQRCNKKSILHNHCSPTPSGLGAPYKEIQKVPKKTKSKDSRNVLPTIAA